jgi:hypothetical protein
MNSKRFVIGTHDQHVGSWVVVSFHVCHATHVEHRVDEDRFVPSHDDSSYLFEIPMQIVSFVIALSVDSIAKVLTALIR